MNSVKNQKSCGSCWAFAAIGAMEAAWYLSGREKVVLSEQMLVDCSIGDCTVVVDGFNVPMIISSVLVVLLMRLTIRTLPPMASSFINLS